MNGTLLSALTTMAKDDEKPPKVDKTPPYPEAHPKAAEIKVLKTEIQALYGIADHAEKFAREQYLVAYKALADMGTAHKTMHDSFKDLAKKMKELEAIAEEPLL